jgi:hypothetical protein
MASRRWLLKIDQPPDRSTWYCVGVPSNQTLVRKKEDLGSVW